MNRSHYEAIGRFIRPFRGRLFGLLALTGGLSILAMLPPLLTRAVIDRVIAQNQRTILVPLALGILAVPVLQFLAGFIQVMGMTLVGQSLVMSLRCALYEHLLKLSLRFYGKHSVGKLVNRLMDDTGTLQYLLTVASMQVLSDFACAAFAISVTFSLNWRLALVLVLMVVFFVVNYRANIGPIRVAARSAWGAQDRLAGGIQNRLVANLTVKTFGAESREQTTFREQSGEFLQRSLDSQYASTAFGFNTALLQRIGHALIYFLGCALVLDGDATYGDVIAFTAYAMQLLWPAVRVSSLAQQIQEVGVSMDRIYELFDEKPEVASRPGAVKTGRLRGKVDFDHVDFGYEKDTPVLQDFDLHIPAGSTVALVGPTGCGKSTLLSLLLRFFDVTGGAIRIDDIDVRDLDLRSLRRQFGIVLQESLLFDVTIEENIRYSRPDATPEEVRRAAQVAEIHAFIESLADGYASRLGSRGIQISTGQKQRLNIARAVLADPGIIIMDEATSALDSESERAIQAAMGRFLVGRTSFVVAHRLSTIRNADRIVLLRDGRIVEMGPHDELMAIPDGRYHDLYLKHAGKGIITDEPGEKPE